MSSSCGYADGISSEGCEVTDGGSLNLLGIRCSRLKLGPGEELVKRSLCACSETAVRADCDRIDEGES